MYYNPTYMNPIMKGLNQGQPQQQEPLEGIASLAPKQPTQPIPTQPSQPLDPQMTTGIETLDTSNPTIDDPLRFLRDHYQRRIFPYHLLDEN